ncbi:amino acid adenylation domain-containing protein [Nocardia sp. CDC159]|uniref:Amino acid adenylation domain-containing protein n=1 Tax=Nocardia pulmonis TaxID=2951408 RepID=A0A9X2E843_9NOCA|nr:MULTISPECIES: Pls/PosA family non-ribosomal peptide synthetase [Nocardia]MCM6774630.1 amino acid adenylation domain-containing protein [Nocardia pulmonis]MCM6787305.1 amino acid adenylation domain-containing protein [Nocardia sp. CDC159]
MLSPVVGTRPATRRMHRIFESSCDRAPDALALDGEGITLSYSELDSRANRLAHHLINIGVTEGTRVAILLSRSVHTYVALLAIGKAGGTFVPIDPGAPPNRVAYIVADAEVAIVVTAAEFDPILNELDCGIVRMDTDAEAIAAAPATRPNPPVGERDPIAYVMYTSGSSGRPKGVLIAQSSICNFLDIVPEVYDIRPGDRVYQGMTISFDFSIEEIWPTWARGATLVPGPTDSRRLGGELAEFLDAAGITVLYCVPTLLATIPREIPALRTILVGGEACPAHLVDRWARPGRRMLNTYGPTETTVTATVGELLPGRPVTIGTPLPTYSLTLLDDHRNPVPHGEIGEICIGGPGVALGYIGRPDLTADRFIDHPAAPGAKLYRTGDLGRLDPDGQLEYHGRADAEVKIRGHRIDLGEIESVLMEDEAVTEAVVSTTAGTDDPELAAYVVLADPAAGNDELRARLYERMRERLPAYMVASYVEVLAALPTMPSGKVDRRQLPAPASHRFVGSGPVIAPADTTEERIRAVWAEALGLPPASISVTADFFTDLGGHSLLAARVVSRLRESGTVPHAALRLLYRHPTIREMAAHTPAPASTAPTEPARKPLRHTNAAVARSGFAQLVVLYLLLLVTTLPLAYVDAADDGRLSLHALGQLLAALLVADLAVRWLLPLVVGRLLTAGIRPGRYPLWGTTYLRLWAMQLLLKFGPLPILAGSPLGNAYLRLLGARIGTGAHIGTGAIGLPSMLDIGPGAALGYGVTLSPWRVEDGWVIVAPITVGADAFVGAHALLEPGSRVASGAALGQQSALGTGVTVPAGERWAGSPAAPTQRLSDGAEAILATPTRRVPWTPGQLVAYTVAALGLEVAAIAMMLPAALLVSWALLRFDFAAGLLATMAAGPIFVLTVCAVVALGKRLVLPRLPVGIHPARSGLGIRKFVADKLFEYSLGFTHTLYATLYTVPWLRLLGARIGRGAEVSNAAHIDPDLLELGEGTFVADMASVGAATFGRGWISVAPTTVGRRSFVGNAAVVSAGTRVGEGALVGVCTLPPHTGVPDGTSWLGSPAIRLPVRQDSGDFPESTTYRPSPRLIRQRLLIEFFRATMPASLLAAGSYLYLSALSVFAHGDDLGRTALLSPLIAAVVAVAIVGVVVGIKRVVVGRYRPRVEPLWDLFVRRTEFVTGLYESAAVPAALGMLAGTPFLPIMLRWFGADIGQRVWLGTTFLTEFDLVVVGDDAAVGPEAALQTHLFEDRVMKMSTVTVRPGASVGTRSVVLYDSVVGDGVVLDALSLLMKGEQLTADTRWGGIPAQPRDSTLAQLRAS